ncbi:phage terminase small subunit P27 family [Lactococcus lactis]|uniref:phage terminase small subunit P27 family n=1 Tax=Lactococcus lactis TaxID=1358 RepID=UPI00117B5863|nr:phage terminase small subunit P27 family [Lactococcus lactis]MCT3137043.1 phage terminase small subunit P27 family [Lactococcus lactis]TRW75966.1 phage terminase small subunit P27 family [Lactococcus lactis]
MTAKKFKDSNDGKLSYRAPKHLSPLASACWRKTAPFLEEQKPVDKIDSFLVEMYCTQYEIYRNSYEHLKKHGEVQEIYKPVQDMTGEIIDRQFQGFKRNPMTQIYSDAIKNLTKIGSELGLSPKSRSELIELNMQDTNEKSTKDKMKAFFDGGDDDDY